MAINVTRSSMPSYEEYCEEIKSIWENRWLTNCGPIHNRLCSQLKDYLKVENLELFVNGHLALVCALRAMALQGEIITTPFTFASTTNAIMDAGCTPVYCDVKEDYTIDEEKIESLITDRTVAILGVHVYGNICNVERIEEIARKHGLKVIYDGAHVFGVEYNGRGICQYGDVTMLSFHATKVFHTIEGGALCFNDPSLTEKLVLHRSFGVQGDTLKCFGTNAKMNEFSAAMGICNLRHIDAEIASRGKAYMQYRKRLENVAGITLLSLRDGVKPNYAYFPVLFDKARFGKSRDEVMDLLAQNGINARKYFYPLVSANEGFGETLMFRTPQAQYYAENILCVPLYAHMEELDIPKICSVILE